MSLISAERIRKKTINSPEIKTYVSEIIKDINAGITTASVSCNTYKYEMPTEIHIPGLAKSNSQRIIYYHVAKRITKAGYTLEIVLKPKTFFEISWVTDMDEEDSKLIDKYLARLIKKTDIVDKRLTKKSKPKNILDDDFTLKDLDNLDNFD